MFKKNFVYKHPGIIHERKASSQPVNDFINNYANTFNYCIKHIKRHTKTKLRQSVYTYILYIPPFLLRHKVGLVVFAAKSRRVQLVKE